MPTLTTGAGAFSQPCQYSSLYHCSFYLSVFLGRDQNDPVLADHSRPMIGYWHHTVCLSVCLWRCVLWC